jgi:phosphoribosylcarboxyaminoimidazole (NCAIR) mutase
MFSSPLAGCAFTVPSAPTVSVWSTAKSKWDHSPAAHAMMKTAHSEATKSVIFDEAKRCENRLSALVSKMKGTRSAKGVFAVLGGSATITGSFIAATQHNDKSVQISSASVAAVGGLISVVSALVGDPMAELDRYNKGVAHYEAARKLADNDAAGLAPCSAGADCGAMIRTELSACTDDTK